MKRKCYLVLLVMFFFINSCDKYVNHSKLTEEENTYETEISVNMEKDNEVLWIYNEDFRIWKINEEMEKDDFKWRYEITSNAGSILDSGTTEGYMPDITSLDSNIIRLSTEDKLNTSIIQYFDLQRDCISQKFSIISVYADYVDDYYITNMSPTLIALPYLASTGNVVLVIQSIFDNSFYLEIEEKPHVEFDKINSMRFLRENELYIDYNKKAQNGEYINKRTIIVFDSSNQIYNEFSTEIEF